MILVLWAVLGLILEDKIYHIVSSYYPEVHETTIWVGFHIAKDMINFSQVKK